MSVTGDDLYARLGVERGADAKEIKSAYRRLARQHHPDVNPNDPKAEERFKAISMAYKILSDEKKRAIYDRHGMAAFAPGGAATQAGVDMSDFEDLFSNLGFDDIFSTFFGGGRQARASARSARRPGEDVGLQASLELEDVVAGVSREERVSVQVPCQECAATGTEPGSAPRVCQRCRGVGRVRRNMGFLQVESECPDCRGMGRREKGCRHCRGEGRLPGHESLRFRIPPGVRDGAKIRYQGKGHAGRRGGPRGNLFVLVKVRPHKMFRRVADDLAVRAHLTLPELLLGTALQVTGINGEEIAVVVPPGSADGDEVRVRGKGLPGLRGGHGDLRVVLRAERSRLSRKSKAMVEELAALLPRVKRRLSKP